MSWEDGHDGTRETCRCRGCTDWRRLSALRARDFPIQEGDAIPWAWAEKAYVTYARLFGKQQSLERLAERGGFGLVEWACLYLGHDPGAHTRTDKLSWCVQRAVRAAMQADAVAPAS
jgi:hypothetical protein